MQASKFFVDINDYDEASRRHWDDYYRLVEEYRRWKPVRRVAKPQTGPRRTWLYRLFDSDGALLYIGITYDWAKRSEQHAKDKPWWNDVVNCALTRYDDRETAEKAEWDAIGAERPRHNVAGHPDLVQREWGAGAAI